MTYEYAVYYKLMLLCGYKDELLQYIDKALVDQDPLSDIVLELSTAGSDDKKMLSVLNDYLLQVKDSEIDYDVTVFDYVMSFLKRRYVENAIPMKEIAKLMYRLAVHIERYCDEPWHTMYFLGELFDEAENGYFDKGDYQRKFEAFINDRICFCDYPTIQPKDSFFKRLFKRIWGNY
ncbi:MAG: hypothetical protein PUB43_05230 [Oscillospiraceae bacterium]|nr:hypothetical protein [Oscillospiraceae bacterium]